VEEVIGVVAQRLHPDRQDDFQDVALLVAVGQESVDVGAVRQTAARDHGPGEGGEGGQIRVGDRCAGPDRLGDLGRQLRFRVRRHGVGRDAVFAAVLAADGEKDDFLLILAT
jgi:hypothetical protein